MANQLTTNSQIQCPHGGIAQLATTNTQVLAEGATILLESDIHPVVGCSFLAGTPKYSPCVKIQWSGGSSQITVNRTATLTNTSIGQCFNAENTPQGVAIVVNTQQKTSTT